MFFTLDGVDGVGKSTQGRLFCEWLREAGHEVTACRDPGSTEVGEAIRQILLDGKNTALHRRAEMLLYMAARAQLVEEVIAPALAAGRVVVSDRYLLANVVYQGHAGGLDVDELWRIGQIATAGVAPDMTFLLDMPPEAARSRLDRALDRMEQQPTEFRLRLRQGFLDEAARRSEIVVIAADRPVEAVQTEIRSAASRVLKDSSTATPSSRRVKP